MVKMLFETSVERSTGSKEKKGPNCKGFKNVGERHHISIYNIEMFALKKK